MISDAIIAPPSAPVTDPAPAAPRQTRFMVTLHDTVAQMDVTAELRELGPYIASRRLYVVHEVQQQADGVGVAEPPHLVAFRGGVVACVSEACFDKPCVGERAVLAHETTSGGARTSTETIA